jgi:hypothetical protein
MKNIVVCKNCQAENPFYSLICKTCKGFLRERIFNIDFWKVLALLIESPVKGFKTIIYSEHKNFIFFILLLAAGKFTIDLIFFSVLFNFYHAVIIVNFPVIYIIVLIALSLLTLAFSFLLFYIGKPTGIETRKRDNFSILTYSFVPHVFSLFILFPIEIIIFGGNLFSTNPSPFVLKPGIAYTLLIIELLIILWGMFLTAAAVYTQLKNIIVSVFVSAAFTAAIFSFCYYFSG